MGRIITSAIAPWTVLLCAIATDPFDRRTSSIAECRLADPIPRSEHHVSAQEGVVPLGGLSKRLLDITVALIALLVLSPLMVVVAILIRLTDRTPVVIAHHRVGYGGTLFRCFKFRTMVVNGDEVLAKHLASNPEAAREWAENRKLLNDPRVTPIGAVLRKTSIDELPQLINVLKGEMSCVGPRPIVPSEVEKYGRQARHYLQTCPGLTGIWQVSGRSSTTYRQRVVLDTFYKKNWSIWLDLWILGMTIPTVMRIREAA